jgi:hypothetical protein
MMARGEAMSAAVGSGVVAELAGEWDDICSPLASVPVWLDPQAPARAGAPGSAVHKHSHEGLEVGDDFAAAWELPRAEAGQKWGEGISDVFADVWCASALPLPLPSPQGVVWVASAQAQQAQETDASQASSRVASPVLVAQGTGELDSPVPAVVIDSSPEGDAKAGRGAPRPRVSAYNLELVDEKTRRRLIKNRASAERSRMQRKAKMEELELRCERQEQEIQRLRAQLESVSKHLNSDVKMLV